MILKNNQRIDGCSDTVPIGSLNPYLGSTAPYGYLICEGQLVSKAIYPELYSICGSIYGTETSTHFYLPDLRGKVIAGYKENDAIFGTLGGLAGELTHLHTTSSHTLTTDEIPSHSHKFSGNSGVTYNESNLNRNGTAYDQPAYYKGADWTGNGYITIANTGGGQAHSHGDTGSTSSVQPSMPLNWIVKAFQLMPNQSYVATSQQTSDVNTYSCTYINNALAGVTSNAIVIDDEEPQTASTQLWINPDEELSHVESDPDVYALTETKTNKIWIDGKTVYRRVFQGTLGTNITHGITNATFINIWGFYSYNNSTDNVFPLPIARPGYPDYACGIYVNQSQICFDKGTGSSALPCVIVLEYVRTISNVEVVDDQSHAGGSN